MMRRNVCGCDLCDLRLRGAATTVALLLCGVVGFGLGLFVAWATGWLR